MQRIKSIDLARGFTVLMFVPVHAVMLYSKLTVRGTALGIILSFLAEWHGAQIFMTVMGISFTFSKKNSLESVLKRALILLTTAYALNIFKFVLPHLFGLLPKDLLDELQIQKGNMGFLQLFLIGDILHFAAIAFFILYFIYRLRNYHLYALASSIIICFASPLLWGMHSRYYLVDYLFQLAGGNPPAVYFPLFPWLVYPLIGLVIGHYLHRYRPSEVFEQIKRIAAMLFLAWLVAIGLLSTDGVDSFYRSQPFYTVLHASTVLIFLSVWNSLAGLPNNHFFRLLEYLSENITSIYIIQWVLIFWLLPVFGYHDLGLIGSLACIICLSILTFFVSVSINMAIKKTKKLI